MSGPIEDLLGSGGKPSCRVVSKDVAVHWWTRGAQPGDACLCGLAVLPAADGGGFEDEEEGPLCPSCGTWCGDADDACPGCGEELSKEPA